MKNLFDKLNTATNISLNNRIFMAPMTIEAAFHDGSVTEEMVEYYAHRSGEEAAVIVESCFVKDNGRGFAGALGGDTDDKIPGLTKLATAIKNKGSKALLQIYHAGRMATPELNKAQTPICPSPVAALRPGAVVPTEMTKEDIEEMITLFAETARRAIKAGFDGVEIHGANTYLVQQFFSPHSNRREDEWGGSLEKRAKFPLEVLRNVKKVVAEEGVKDFIIGYRISPEELEEPGIRFEDTVYLLEELAKENPDYFHFSLGAWDRGSIVNKEDNETLISKYVKMRSENLARIPIMGVGGIVTKEDAESALAAGYDLVSVGKAFIATPDWAARIKNGEEVRATVEEGEREELKIPLPTWNFLYDFNMVKNTAEEARKAAEYANVKLEYKPGTYTVFADGHNDAFKIDVTFTKDRIEKIEIDAGSESEGLSTAAFEQLPDQIINFQTLNVDIVSGASASSNGIINGVAEAVEKAGANAEVLKYRPKPVIELSTEVEEVETDLVVVGGGAAGIASSLRADQLGLKVKLIDKMSFIGGAISVSGGNQVVMGSKLQKQGGVTEDNAEIMMEDFRKNGNYKNVEELLSLLAHNVGETTDWVHEYVGVKYDTEAGLRYLAEYKYKRELAYLHGGHGFAASIREKIDNSNIDVHVRTKVEELLVEDGKVVGVRAVEDGGKTYIIKSKAVILASGGYGYAKDILSKELKNVLYYGIKSSTGDGIKMAQAKGLNAATRMMEYGKIYPNGVEVAPGLAKSTIGGNIFVLRENGLLVNTSGNRVVNEKLSNADILKVQLEQDPQLLYLLLDQEHFEIFKREIAEGGISEKDVDKWLENNGKETPFFLYAESLEELAEIAKMPLNSLKNTVERYNKFVEQGLDEDFARQPEFMQKKVGHGPYYLIEQKPRFATTMGGLVANTNLQVLNDKDEVISGLYAAGEVVGGVMGTDSPSGANNAWALTSGKLAAEHIALNK